MKKKFFQIDLKMDEEKNNLSIIILGSSANLDSKGQTPDSLIDLFNSAEINNIELSVYLIDPIFSDVFKLNTENDNILNEREKLYNLMDENENIHIINNFYTFNKERDFLKNDLIVISYIGLKSYYDLMYITEIYPSEEENNFFLMRNEKINIEDVMNDYFQAEKTMLVKPYDIYQGDKYVGDNMGEIKEIYLVMCNFILNYFSAKIDKKDTRYPEADIPSWCYNTEIPVLKGLIIYYGLFSENEIHKAASEICESAFYRNQIMTYMCQILANFVINNSIIEKEDVKKWMSVKTFRMIKRELEN